MLEVTRPVSSYIVARMIRAALFTLVGVLFMTLWLRYPPTYGPSDSQSDWHLVLGFSAGLVCLAFALPMFARLVGSRDAFRVSFVSAGGAVLGSVSNILEDGLQMGWAFWGFILSLAIFDLGLLALTGVITFVARGGLRLLALVSATTLAGLTFYVAAGGILMLAAWLGAATLAIALPTRKAAQASLTTL